MNTPLPRILLIDWDEDFARDLGAAIKAYARLEHLFSAPELKLALELATAPVLIMVDIDAFRLLDGAPLTSLIKNSACHTRVFLTRQTHLSLELAPGFDQVTIARKDAGALALAAWIWELVDSTPGLNETMEQQPKTLPKVPCIEGQLLSYGDIIELQRQAMVGRLASGICQELNNINSILIGATEELSRAMRGKQEDHLDTIADLQWVHQNLKTYADHLLRVSRSPRRVVEMVDVNRTMQQTLTALESLGKTKYIGVESELGYEELFVRISRAHLEHVLINIISLVADGVLNSQATIRRLHVEVHHAVDKERVELRVTGSMSRDHANFLLRCLAGEESESSETLDLLVSKRLVDANGGVLHASVEQNGEALTIHTEFPTEFAAAVTSPSLYKLDTVRDPPTRNFLRSAADRPELKN